ncbi:MAG TPA: hypothetical protein VFN11_18575 [Ktedonobacterales bacterium]|nr:hypothetical protein [Ktedonobacterales bacterium]
MDSMGQQGQQTDTTDSEDHQPAPIARISKLRGISAPHVTPNSRARALVAAISRLEQEHVALLLALCDLEEAPVKGQDIVMRSALDMLLREELRFTQHALTLAAQGMYGVCEVCQRPLSRRHLSLLPAITRCSSCASQMPSEH